MRLIGDNLEELSTLSSKTIETGIYPIALLKEWAEACDMDLVEISPNAIPCC